MKPNVGMVYPVCAPVATYTPGTSITYSAGSVVSEARGATINYENASGEFYGDDVRLDSENGLIGYSIDFESSGLKGLVRSKLLGEKVIATDEYRITGADSPDMGFGFIRKMREDVGGQNVTRYEAWWAHKLKFSIGSEETRTKENQIEWRVPTLSGKGDGVYLDSDENPAFIDHKDFETLAAAKSYLNTKANIQTVTT